MKQTLPLIILFMSCLPVTAPAETFTVDNLADDASAPDDNPGDDVCADALGACTLRAAIEEANADGASDDIEFGVTGTITVSDAVGPMPALGETVFIQGPTTGSPGNRPGDSPPAVTLDGSALAGGGNNHGLRFLSGAGGSNLTSLAIVNFPDNGIQIDGANVLIDGCFIGVEPDGTAAGNGGAGISGIASDSIFGKFAFGDALAGIGNVISSNGGDGIILLGGNNILAGNFIGVEPDGIAARANAGDGLQIAGTGNLIGLGQFEHAENVIAGNDGDGLLVGGSAAEIEGNRVGINKVGNARGNGVSGITLIGDDHVVGSNEAHGANQVANNGAGITLGSADNAADNNLVQFNEVGVTTFSQGNTGFGIRLIDGTGNTIDSNQVINNDSSGIFLESGAVGNMVTGNRVGFVDTVLGLEDHGNGTSGIADFGTDNRIGGSAAGDGNAIGFNEVAGISINGDASTVLGNYIGLTMDYRPMGHLNSGINISTGSAGAVIGNPDAGNVIGHNLNGVFSNGIDVTIENNAIGIGNDGSPQGNTTNGINLQPNSDDTTVLHNEIAYNGTDGVSVTGNSLAHSIIDNAMHDNGDLGIDLGDDGVTANDPGDPDTGPNNFMNHPEVQVLGYSQVDATLMIEYSVDATSANAGYPLRIDFYWHDRDESNQGRQYYGAFLYETPQAVVTEELFFPLGTTGGTLRATATDFSGGGNTSELSPERMFGFFDFIFADGFEGS